MFVGFLNGGGTIEQAAAILLGSPEYLTNRAGGTNDGFLSAVYHDVLGRDPDPMGRTTFSGLLASAAWTRQQVALALLTSDEGRILDLGQIYQAFLGRPLDPSGEAVFLNLMQHGTTDELVIAILMGSDEYFARAAGPGGSNNARLVDQMYNDLLHRAPDPTGLALFTGLFDHGASRSQVAGLLLGSPEYRQDAVDALYVHYLHRHADPIGLALFVGFLAGGGTDEVVASSLLGSPEYLTNRAGGTNDGFISAVYRDVLGRDPDPIGRTTFGGLLAGGAWTRQQVALALLSSDEGRSVDLGQLYQTVLGRPLDPSGQAVFLNLMHHGGTDEQVIAILMGSPEYFARATTAGADVNLTFTDGDPVASMANFTATVDWGDGTTSPLNGGTVALSGIGGGPYTLRSTHFYVGRGTFTISVAVADDGGSHVGATLTFTR